MISKDRQLIDLVISLVECATGRHQGDLSCATRGLAPVARARQVAMYLAHTQLSFSLARVGTAFGRDKSTVSHAVHQIEDLRDDLAFDDWLEELEQALGALNSSASRSSEVLSGVWRKRQPELLADSASA